MKIKIESLVNAQNALSELAQKNLSIATSFKVAKLIKAAQAELQTYDEQRRKLLENVGSKLDESTNQYIIPKDKRENFAMMYRDLLDVEIDLPGEKINITDEKITLSPETLLLLEPFVEFGGEGDSRK